MADKSVETERFPKNLYAFHRLIRERGVPAHLPKGLYIHNGKKVVIK